jgi:anaerobic selenocysteine-containing dehydrogenase
MYWHSMGRQVPSLRRLQPEPLLEIHPDTARKHGLVDKGYAWIETRRGRLRMRVRCARRTHPDVASVPHGWWLPEWPGPEHGIYEVCSNVLTDDDPENCDIALGSSPLKGLLCKVYPADPPERPRDGGYRRAAPAAADQA